MSDHHDVGSQEFATVPNSSIVSLKVGVNTLCNLE